MSFATTAQILENKPETTPMMRQYWDIKSQHPDAILFYRLGDFYEMFYEDAVEASQILGLTLTTRNKNQPNPIPLCGVPYHAADTYLAKLMAQGKKVVICEQVEDPKLAKGLVKREVTRILSPGLVTDEKVLSARMANFLFCVQPVGESFFCALCDVSTGTVDYFSVSDGERLHDEILRPDVREVIYPESCRDNPHVMKILTLKNGLFHHAVSDLYFDLAFATDLLTKTYKVTGLESLGLSDQKGVSGTLGGILGYLQETKVLDVGLLRQPLERRIASHLVMDETSVRNLELFHTLRDHDQTGTLLWHLDQCVTAMGSRKLAEWLRLPLLDTEVLKARLDAVQEFLSGEGLRQTLTVELGAVADLERVGNKFILKSANARDAVALKDSFRVLPQIQNILAASDSPLIQDLRRALADFRLLAQKIQEMIVDEPPLSTKDGGLIRVGLSPELDELRAISQNGKGFIAQMEAKEKATTGIGSLKIRYNGIFGYYIEVTHTHQDKVPSYYIRKQTLTHAERYITDELKDYESKVLGAEERIRILEQQIFSDLRETIALCCDDIKKTAESLAQLDVLCAFAGLAQKFGYTRPQLTTDCLLHLKGAKHPVLERLNVGTHFVPNDVFLDGSQNRLLVITGPNMAGKSTLMRMTALIVIMAQVGSFVPCESATMGLCDRVFTRVGAHDHLQKGLSTFMVEMVETAKILREATAKSLVLLDEIGRGTSTFDGLSIAWAVTEDLHDRIGARTLFATHYHELCDLAEHKKGIKNYHMSVQEWNGEIIFLRRLKSGGTNRSYGVTVASMAGLPPSTIQRAREILKLLEVKDLSFQSDLDAKDSGQISLFGETESALTQELKLLDVNAITPIEALNVLMHLKSLCC
jgi:DNA mismatch repair protein MutS